MVREKEMEMEKLDDPTVPFPFHFLFPSQILDSNTALRLCLDQGLAEGFLKEKLKGRDFLSQIQGVFPFSFPQKILPQLGVNMSVVMR